jgi:hypothetical protein
MGRERERFETLALDRERLLCAQVSPIDKDDQRHVYQVERERSQRVFCEDLTVFN